MSRNIRTKKNGRPKAHAKALLETSRVVRRRGGCRVVEAKGKTPSRVTPSRAIARVATARAR